MVATFVVAFDWLLSCYACLESYVSVARWCVLTVSVFQQVHASALLWAAGDVRVLPQPLLASHNLLMICRARAWLLAS